MSGEEDNYVFNDNIKNALKNLAEFIERLIVPSKLEALTIQDLARILLVLRRMPYLTPGIEGGIGIVLTEDRDVRYFELRVSEDEFELADGGSVYTEGVGSDSYSTICFYMQPGGYNEGSKNSILNWIENASDLVAMGATLSVDAEVFGDINWEENTDECEE